MKYIIMVSGKATSGKDTFSAFLRDNFLNDNKICEITHFAKKLKQECIKDFTPIINYLNSYVDKVVANIENVFNVKDFYKNHYNDPILDNLLKEVSKIKLDKTNFYSNKTELSRIIMQVYGNDIVRNKAGNEYWINELKKEVGEFVGECITVSDCRYVNEIESFNNNEEYKVIRIRIDKKVEESNHISENDLDNYEIFDYIVDNNGSYEDLEVAAKLVYEDLNNESNIDAIYRYFF